MPDDALIHIIPSPEGDLHSLVVTRAGETLLVHSNNRQMYGEWGTFGFSETMAKQLIAGLQAILSGAPRAVTPTVLRMEQEERSRREERTRAFTARTESVPDLSAYDNLFSEDK